MSREQLASRPVFSSNSAVYEQVLDAIPDLVLIKGPKSKICWANKAFRDFYGMTNAQLYDLIDAPFNEPDYTRQYVKDDATVFETRKPLNIPSEPATRHDGVVRHFQTQKSPIFNEDGEVVLTIGTSRDIEDSQHLEALLRQAEKLSAMGQLAAGVAHEINNPLSIILGFAEAIQRRIKAEDPIYEGMASIVRESIRCKDLVQHLLSFARQRVPGFKLEHPGKVLRNALALIEAQARVRNILIDLDIQQDLTEVWMDRNQIEQVLINLCANAIDAMSPGGRLSVFVHQTGPSLIIQVVDTGTGIPPEVQTRMFEPFFTTKEIGKGTGLGLSLAYDIVQKHQGQIEFKTTPGKGTTFTVRLPIKNKARPSK